MIYILLPAYNEEDALEPLITKVDSAMRQAGFAYRVVVVNDGSKDRTGCILEQLSRRFPMDVLTHKYNRGLGETGRDGFEFIAERADPADVIVRMDCDDTHEPDYIRAMVDKLNEGYEVVTASRYAPGGGQIGVNLYRRTISRCANLLMKLVFPIPGVWEYTCGYRAYRVSHIQDALKLFGNRWIDLKGMGFTGTVEKMIKCRLMRARVGQIPFVLRYDQKTSVSKVVTNLTTLGYLVLIAKYAIPWGDLGDEWQRAGRERRARLYDEKGRLRLGPVRVDA